jgi:hypothetical protein
MLDHLATLHPAGLILTRDALAVGGWPALQLAARRGDVERIWPGVYAFPAHLAALTAEKRHLLILVAMLSTRGRVNSGPGRAVSDDPAARLVFADVSAAVIWNLPVFGVPLDRVHLAISDRNGGRSKGRLVRHASSHVQAVRLKQATAAEPAWVTSIAQTVIDIARRHPFASGLAVADHALREGMVTRDELEQRQLLLGRSPGCHRSARVLRHADARAASVLESVSRVQMIDLDLAPDDLQRRYVDSSGREYEVDFWWEAANVVGECDGKAKYTDPKYTHGRAAAEVVWEEKKREDAIRLLGPGFVRWTWHEATRPALLRARLEAAGIRPDLDRALLERARPT